MSTALGWLSLAALPPSLSLTHCMAYEHFAHEVQLRRRCNFFYVRVAAAIAASAARSFALILSQVCMSVPWCVCVCATMQLLRR